GMGGYGPVQYYYLIDEARKMGAQRIVIAFYLGNDVTDAFGLPNRLEKWAFLRRECETDDLPPFELCPVPCEIRDPSYWEPDLPTIQLKQSGSVLWTIHSYLRLNSVFYAMAYESALKPAVQALFEKSRQITPGSFAPASLGLIFTPSMNLTTLDLRHDHIRCGCKIIRRILALMAQKQNAREELLFVIIPTRENIYHKRLKRDGIELPPSFECQVHYEREISRFIAGELRKNGFRFIDVQPQMEEAALQNRTIYPRSGDHHPSAAGYALIAAQIYKALSLDPIRKQ
ncbi:MAG: hypothetical protein LLG06_10920, partial [Desulfobacteraceae bacterium]|nr:hypothetical protein [Desulfobacteraceae bacterium]